MREHREIMETLGPEWHESLFGVELALLLASPVYYGEGVPKGDGSAVLPIPGFMHGDTYLVFLYAWLKRIGYRPYYSSIGVNASCPNLLISEIIAPILRKAVAETHGKIHLIGHSLGGAIARSIASQCRDIASVMTLASPMRQTLVRDRIFQNAEMVRNYLISQQTERVRPQCLTVECPCPFMKSLRRPFPSRVNLTAIYTRNDGLVEWQSCRTGNSGIDAEVRGTHTGLAFNPAVYKIIAQRLAASRTRRRSTRVTA